MRLTALVVHEDFSESIEKRILDQIENRESFQRERRGLKV
jgi:hypothetical protein